MKILTPSLYWVAALTCLPVLSNSYPHFTPRSSTTDVFIRDAKLPIDNQRVCLTPQCDSWEPDLGVEKREKMQQLSQEEANLIKAAKPKIINLTTKDDFVLFLGNSAR